MATTSSPLADDLGPLLLAAPTLRTSSALADDLGATNNLRKVSIADTTLAGLPETKKRQQNKVVPSKQGPLSLSEGHLLVVVANMCHFLLREVIYPTAADRNTIRRYYNTSAAATDSFVAAVYIGTAARKSSVAADEVEDRR
ncbi:hypothetical protein EJB05_50969, partial [Eragrostis curvula]